MVLGNGPVGRWGRGWAFSSSKGKAQEEQTPSMPAAWPASVPNELFPGPLIWGFKGTPYPGASHPACSLHKAYYPDPMT